MTVIGIDLGTTNSCVAVVRNGEPEIIPSSEGARTTASVVAWTPDGEHLVGDMAKRQAITNAKNTVTGVKRILGRGYDSPEVTAVRERAPYAIERDSQGEMSIRAGGRSVRPEEVSSMLLSKLRDAAEQYLGEEVREAVITVPAYFDDRQRRATRDAARIAGLEVRRLVNEPTAAALAYGSRETDGDSELVVVFDLGGGTFDVTVLEIGADIYHVRATLGDCFLGGTDFNARLVGWLEERFLEQTEIDLRTEDDPTVRQRLVDAAESAKIALSSSLETSVNLPFLAVDDSGPLHLECSITRGEYEALVEDLVAKTLDVCRSCLEDAGIAPDAIDNLILVGGQTRMPMIRTAVRDFFGKIPLRNVNPDEVVACGAALQAGVVAGEVKDQILLDVIPLSLGIATAGGVMTQLIPRNTSIPTQARQIFTTARDDQDSVQVHVLQGEAEAVEHNRSLGIFQLYGLPLGPKGTPQVEVCFDVDADGILDVTAVEKTTGRKQGIRLHGSGGLSAAEIDRLMADAEARRQSEKDRRDRAVLASDLRSLAERCRLTLVRANGTGKGELRQQLGRIAQSLEAARENEALPLAELRARRDEADRVLGDLDTTV